MENAAQANPTAPQKSSRTAVLLGIAFSILINGVLPFIIYTALTNYTSLSNYIALVLTGVPSLIDSIVGILRRKRMDILAGIVLTGIAVSLILIALGGSPKVYLIRESFLSRCSSPVPWHSTSRATSRRAIARIMSPGLTHSGNIPSFAIPCA